MFRARSVVLAAPLAIAALVLGGSSVAVAVARPAAPED